MSALNDRKGRRRQAEKPTVADVAKSAGVSPMTVSRVINALPGVRPDTRSKVQEAIGALGYVPNVAARALAGARQCRIAVLYSNPSAAYLSEFLVGSLEGAAQTDAQLIIEHWDGNEGPGALVRRLQAHHIDAVVLPPPLCEHTPLLASLEQHAMPVAQVAGGRGAGPHSAVTIDDTGAAEAITGHLIALGHRRIGFIAGDPRQSASALRRAGYERALLAAARPLDPDLVMGGDYTYRSGLTAADALLSLEEQPTAIFASNDDMAAGVIAVAHRRGLDVPGDLSVCGFDDTAIATTIWPELTTIRQPIAAMARTAVEVLSGMRDAALRSASPQHHSFDFELVVRGSSAPPNAAD